ncbi:MAG: co-chaperone GroES [bacterium]|nr:co-chaperone GroES [bacterium]
MKISVKKLQPLTGYVLVEPTEKETQTASGIILPTNETEKPQYGTILALGEAECNCGKDCQCGKDCACKTSDLKVGDQVVYKKWGGNDVKIDDVEYQFLKYEDILAKIAK